MAECDVQISGRHLSLLVALSSYLHLMRSLHARLDVNIDTSVLSLDGSAIEAENLLLVRDLLTGAVVHL